VSNCGFKDSRKHIYAIAGPTASVRRRLGAELALKIGGEIINCDSVQIYRGIQIATAKPSEEERRGVPHHLIDYVDPNVNYTAADWASGASDKIAEIEAPEYAYPGWRHRVLSPYASAAAI